jgi:hypothetical protein
MADSVVGSVLRCMKVQPAAVFSSVRVRRVVNSQRWLEFSPPSVMVMKRMCSGGRPADERRWMDDVANSISWNMAS